MARPPAFTIAQRARDIGFTAPQPALVALILTYHEEVAPLRLQAMAERSSDFDLAHDVAGILDHMTGHPRPCWCPRYAVLH